MTERRSDAADLADGAFAARQQDRMDRPCSPDLRIAAPQKLRAPHRAIFAQAGTIKDDAKCRTAQMVLNHARSHMRMMMLHLQKRQIQRAGQLRGGIIRMQIADRQLRPHIKEPCIGLQRMPIMLHRLPVFHISDIGAQKHMIDFAQGKSTFFMRTQGHDAAAVSFDRQ